MKERVFFFGAILVASFIRLALADAPAITIRAASDYQKAPAQTATPQASELLITPTDWNNSIPADGIDVFFGKDLQDSLKKTKALTEVLDPQYSIERRFLITAPALASVLQAAVPAFIAAVVGLILGKGASGNAPSVHLASSDIVQLQSQTGSSLAYATSSGAPPITVTVTPTSTSKPAPASVTTLTADNNGHHKGDVLITLPTAQADLLEQLIRKDGAPDKCKNLEKRATGAGGPDFGAISDISQFVLPMAAPGQLLDGLGIQARQILPHIVDGRDQAVQLGAAGLAAFAGVDPGLVSAIKECVWIAVVDICTGLTPDLTQLVLEESLITDDPNNNDDSKCGDKKDAPPCTDSQCSGNDQRVCTKGDKQGCKCLTPVIPTRYPGTIAYWDDIEQILTNFLDGNGSQGDSGDIDCDKDRRINLETSAFTALSKAFCDAEKNMASMAKDITTAEAGLQHYDGYTFDFKWDKGDGDCSSSCTDIFANFTSSSVCAYDSHTFSASGTNKLSCGTASFSFGNGKPPAPSPDTGTKLACGIATDPGNPNHFASLDSMNNAANFFCQKAASAGRDYAPGKIPPDQNTMELNYNHNQNDPIHVSLTYNEVPNCPALDFGSDGTKQVCIDRLGRAINSCDTSNQKGLMYWKQGGTYTQDCVDWSIKRDTFSSDPPPETDSWRPPPLCRNDGDCGSKRCDNSQTQEPVCQIDEQFSDMGVCNCVKNDQCGAPFC